MFIRRFALAAISAVSIGFITVTPAIAHAELVSAIPAADEVVTSWPTQVILTFNEDLLTTDAQQVNFLSVSDSSGVQLDLMDSAVSGSSVSVSLPVDVEPGSYFVNYRVVSADSHVIEDSYEFIFDLGQTESIEPINETEGEPIATPYTSEEESSSNLGLILGLVTLASFVVLIYQFRKNRYK